MKNNIKKIITTLLVLPLIAMYFPVGAITSPQYDVSGAYVMGLEYQSVIYPHDMNLAQDGLGNLTGNGGSPAGANTYLWTITSGAVSGDTIDFFANYTATPDAVTPQTTMHVTGTIAQNGTMSGTWSDNYQGQERSGTWSTTSGNANALGTLNAEDFGVMDASGVKGYTAGFGLTDATFAGATSVVTQLFSGTTLLQTNTAIIPMFNANITGTQFSSPFDVFGTFDYVADGYWTNTRGAEYGQTLTPTKVVATVTLANGKIVTAENTNLTGDPATIFPPSEGSNNNGNVGGEVTQGVGVLNVTSITTTKGTSTADGTFAGGWKYTFHVTLPTNEPNLAMKFADWTGVPSGTIPTANNVRISSLQASSPATVLLTAANVYSTPKLNMVTDLDPSVAGIQTDVVVEVSVPVGTPVASYASTYGINTTP